jgi:hypothetical protein
MNSLGVDCDIIGCFFSFSFLEYCLYGLSYILYGNRSVYNFCVSILLLITLSLIHASDNIHYHHIMFIMF